MTNCGLCVWFALTSSPRQAGIQAPWAAAPNGAAPGFPPRAGMTSEEERRKSSWKLAREASGAQPHDSSAIVVFDAVREAPFAHAIEVIAFEPGIVLRRDLQEEQIVV